MIIAVWNMLQTGETYDEPGGDCYVKRNAERAKRRVVGPLRNLGFTVTLETTAA
jgi:hypothetical protein